MRHGELRVLLQDVLQPRLSVCVCRSTEKLHMWLPVQIRRHYFLTGAPSFHSSGSSPLLCGTVCLNRTIWKSSAARLGNVNGLRRNITPTECVGVGKFKRAKKGKRMKKREWGRDKKVGCGSRWKKQSGKERFGFSCVCAGMQYFGARGNSLSLSVMF